MTSTPAARSVLDIVSIVRRAWDDFHDPRQIVEVAETSAHVSTNRVFRLGLDDATTIVAKVSSYGSYFLFAEDHDRLHRTRALLQGTRWEGFLADVMSVDGRAYTWHDGQCWVAFYSDVQSGTQLPRIVSLDDVEQLGREIAEFHQACSSLAPQLPSTSNSVKGDAIHLLDILDSDDASTHFSMGLEEISLLRASTHEFLLHLEFVHFDEWRKIPILVDWNLGNFSVVRDGQRFRLNTRWDYDWFRIDTRLLDFYFLSRVSSATGDRTVFTYSPHTLLEERFVRFLQAYHEVFPLTAQEVKFLPYAYQFFILNYVVREGAKFFQAPLSSQFRRDAVAKYLPQVSRIDAAPLLDALRLSS